MGSWTMGAKWLNSVANHSSPSNDEVKNKCSYIPTFTYISLA